MTAYFLRVWLPDQPGALGLVASRVGAVKGDVVGIEIIERGAGRAVDELLIELPDDDLVELLVNEIHEIDGADVEDIRPAAHDHEDLAVGALEVAAALLRAETEEATAEVLVEGARRLLHADWAAVLHDSGDLIAGAGDDVPNEAWLAGFVNGVTAEGSAHLEEFAVAAVPRRGWSLVVCRGHLPIRGRERGLIDGFASLG